MEVMEQGTEELVVGGWGISPAMTNVIAGRVISF